MQHPQYPSLYQIHTRLMLRDIAHPPLTPDRSSEGRGSKRTATLADVPDSQLDELASLDFDWVWLLGVWQTGPLSRQVSVNDAGCRREYHELLPDFTDADVCGSPFAVQSYSVHKDFGGAPALARLRQKLRDRGIRLLLDFVPNHTALDHAWVNQRPEFYIHGSESDLAREPHNYCRMQSRHGPVILAHGRDPYFAGWTDTLQLNYRHPGLREAMIEELTKVAGLCDGVRCDMAMLLLPDVIVRTWGDKSLPIDGRPPVNTPFWPEALTRVRRQHADFLLMAEVYWDLEWALQQQGFDYTYDKRFYDRLRSLDADSVRGHVHADMEFQRKSVRFLENHDEPPAASILPDDVHQAAAVLAFFVPGLRFFHEGQLDGRRRRASLHLNRCERGPGDPILMEFYNRLLECLRRPEVRDGRWQLVDCHAAWNSNPTWSSFISFTWEGTAGKRLLIAVNYGPTQGQCYVPLPWAALRGRQVILQDLLSPARYERDGDTLTRRGLYLDLPPWGRHIFELTGTA